jgi:hypothetical protein
VKKENVSTTGKKRRVEMGKCKERMFERLLRKSVRFLMSPEGKNGLCLGVLFVFAV